MGYLKILLSLMAITFVGCGKNLKYAQSILPLENVTGQNLQGSYTDLNGTEVDLKSFDNMTTVLIFAQDTCHVCSEEAHKLSSYAKTNGLPTKFNLTHLLVSSFQDDAVDWITAHQINWSVGIASAQLFRNYCPQQQVPCVLVFKPNLGITFQHTGAVSVDDLLKETGGWKN